MPSTNKTSLGLNQWVLSDQPVMNDFNSDNAILNAAIAALQQPIGTARIADGAVTGDKIANGAVTGEKLSGYPGTYLSSDDIDDVTAPGLYALPNGEILFVYTTSNPVGTAQMRIDTQCRVIYRNKVGDSSWSPPQYYIVPDNSITTSKLVNKAVTAEKLADEVTEQLGQIYPYYSQYDYNIDQVEEDCIRIVGSGTTGTKPPGTGYAIVFTYYPRNASGDTDGYYRVQTAIVEAGGVYTRHCYSVPPATPSWSDWESLGSSVPDGSITTAKIADGAVTGDKIADGIITSDKLAADVIPSELPAEKLLAGAGGRVMQATPYAVRTTESILRVTKDTAGMPPKTIGVPLLSSYAGDTPCSLYFEARAVSGSTASLSPAGNADDGFIGSWTTSGAINGGEWGSFSVENKTGFTGLSILLSSDQAASVDFRNVRVVDAAGIDYVDHATFEAQGTIMEDFPDMPETDATDIPTVAGVKALLAALEARVAALEGGGE